MFAIAYIMDNVQLFKTGWVLKPYLHIQKPEQLLALILFIPDVLFFPWEGLWFAVKHLLCTVAVVPPSITCLGSLVLVYNLTPNKWIKAALEASPLSLVHPIWAFGIQLFTQISSRSTLQPLLMFGRDSVSDLSLPLCSYWLLLY